MIGDLILWLKDSWREQFCIHDYDYRPWYNECKKCGRIK